MTEAFLALKNITGNKKKSLFVVLIISLVLAMCLVVTTIGENILHNTTHFTTLLERNLSWIITGILLLVLFIVVFVSMNLIISGDRKLCGILGALGLSGDRLRSVFLLQALFLSFLSVPLGAGLGIGGVYLLLQNAFVEIYGSFVIPWGKIGICLIACVISIVSAAIYPSIQAGRSSCVEAISGEKDRENQETAVYFPALLPCRSKMSFVFRYALRNLMQNPQRVFSLVGIIALLLSLFILLSSEIERSWKTGNWRQSYACDYEIGCAMGGNPEPRFLDPAVVDAISRMDGVENLYYQYSIFDEDLSLSGAYDYYFKLPEDTLTKEAYRQLGLSCPLTRTGYDQEVFIRAGISGYGEKELALALDYLVEGDVNIQQMKEENIILLPKYILWLENMDIPYTNLQVGDQITLIENKAAGVLDVDIVKEYTFTIGGFVDALPLPQANGVSNGFAAIMYYDKLAQLGTAYQGIYQIYVDETEPGVLLQSLGELCHRNGLTLTDNNRDLRNERQKEKDDMITSAFYALFAVLCGVLFLSVFQILLTNLTLRTREFSLLHIVGVLRWQRNAAILIEMLSFTVPGVIGGILGGVLLILGVDHSGEILSFWHLIPYTHIAVSSFVILLAVVLAAMLGIGYVNRNIRVNVEQA